MNKNILIIGATSGIGLALAKQLGKFEHTLILAGRKLDQLNNVEESISPKPVLLYIDVNNTLECIEQLNKMARSLPKIDMIIHCAGVGEVNEDLNLDTELATTKTNIEGFVSIANWAFHYFSRQRDGHFIVISSVGGLRGNHIAPAYNATKAFQINYLEGLAKKIKKEGLNMLLTDNRAGLVDTGMAKGEGLFWLAPVEKAAQQMYFAIKNKKRIAYVTKRWRTIAWILKLLPRNIYLKL